MLSPHLPRSLAVGRFVLGVLPAVLTVLFAGVIALLALLMDKSRREYALQVADRFIAFASVLVGAQSIEASSGTEHQRPQLPTRSSVPPDAG